MAINPLIGYGILSGVGSLASSLFGANYSQKMSKDLMAYQYQLQQQAIDRMNEYNSPKNQMMRLAEASLNPNLVYGSGVDGNQSTASSVGLSNRNIDFGNPVRDALQSANIGADSMVKQQSVKESESRVAKNQAELLNILLDNKWKDKTLDDRIEQTKANLAHTLGSTNLMEQQTSNLKGQANMIEEQIKYTRARTGLTEAQIKTELCKPEQVKAMTKEILSRRDLNEANRKVAESMLKVNDARVAQLMASAFALEQSGLLSFENWQAAHALNDVRVGGNITPKDILNYIILLIKEFAK